MAMERNGPWKCFHCDETFHTVKDAAMHFGEDEACEPMCNIRPAAVREMMKQLISYMDEDTELHRQLTSMRYGHSDELRKAEEKGYDKAVQDCLRQFHEWGQKMWDDEVKNRPSENIYRRVLDNCWRRVKEFQF